MSIITTIFTITGIIVWGCLAALIILYYTGVVDVGVQSGQEAKDDPRD